MPNGSDKSLTSGGIDRQVVRAIPARRRQTQARRENSPRGCGVRDAPTVMLVACVSTALPWQKCERVQDLRHRRTANTEHDGKKLLRSRVAFVLISKLYRQMYANTGIATDSARVNRANRWARVIARPCRRLFVARPLPTSGNALSQPARPVPFHSSR